MRALITLVLSTFILNAASNEEMRVKLLESIFSGVNLNKEIVLWSDNKDILSLITSNKNYKTTDNCANASLLVLQNDSSIGPQCKNADIFVLDYNLLSNIPTSFGALFWKKGRPNIILIKPRLKDSSIKVSKQLEKYVEDIIW